MTDDGNKYWAFLSFSHQDNRGQRPDAPDVSSLCWGDWLHNALKNFPVPKDFAGQVNSRGEIIPERIHPIFQDDEEQPGDAGLSEDIRKALEQSICLVVVCSPRSAKSLHVNEAVRYFKQLGRGENILPIVVAGEPYASDGKKSGISPDDECFVPAMRHAVRPDGTIDPARRAGKCIFVDARHGANKREILAKDHRNAEADLEMAKTQLIALLIGVGFNGLWWREQKRHFFDLAETQQQAREALRQVEEAQRQLQAAQREVREAQSKALEAQNLPRDIHNQIQEAQNQALAARNQAGEAQKQFQEFQNKFRETQAQLEEARNRALAAESKVLEAQNQAREALQQLEETRHQAREAQSKVLEIQNQPPEVPNPIQIQEAQSQVQEARNRAQTAQSQLEETQKQAQEAQDKFLEAQRQVQELQSQARSVQSELVEARNQVREVQGQVLEAQKQAREAQNKVQEIQNQTRDVQGRIKESADKAVEAQNQARTAQAQVQEIQKKSQAARRLAKVLALIAVLAALAASIAWWQRKIATQALAKAATTEAGEAGPLNREQIQQALQKNRGAGPEESQFRSLDALAARVPAEEISNTLAAAAAILDDPQRSHFQEQLVDFWAKTNAPAAFDWSCQLTNIDSRQYALEKIVPATAADAFTNTLARLNDLKPVPDEQIYTLLFQRWATKDPVQAIEQRQTIPGQDATGQILSTILEVWADQQPEAALKWLEAQPDSEALPAGTWRNLMIAGLFDVWAAKDLAAATSACQQLPDGTAKEKAWEFVLSRRIEADPASAADDVTNLPAGNFRQAAIGELCNRWTATNVLAWAQSLPAEAERIAAINQVIANCADKDPQSAVQFTNVLADLSGTTLGKIATAWSRRDLNATTNWVASLPDGEKKDAALLALAETWVQRDPQGMVTYALGLPAGDTQTRYLTAACRQLALRDLPGTVELLQPLADAELRQSILEEAARNCDLPHLEQAAKYITAMPADADQKAAIKGLVANWTTFDPEAAVNWLVSFPETNAQPEPVQSVIKAWSQREPAAVAQWLAKTPAGTASDGTVSAFLEGAVEQYPAFAWQWTQSVTDDAKRQKFQLQIARQWMKSDPSAALAWINGLELPDKIKQQLKGALP
ncbi:MAG: TIR domain-containing protein [Verrucomicrobiae bacterium]|nr:TIR domain-containing protein [Verrucomicrobiae bacterium]